MCHLFLSSTRWAWFPFLVTFLLCPLSPALSFAGSSLPFPFLQGADSLPLSLPNFSHCQALWCAGYPRGGSFLTSQALFSLWQQNRLPLAPGKRGLGVGWSRKGHGSGL